MKSPTLKSGMIIMPQILKTAILIFIIINVTYGQFDTKTLSVSGSMSWQRNYIEGEETISILSFVPTLGYFFKENLSINAIFDTYLYTYPKKWGGDPDLEIGIGVGLKYFYHYFYGGSSFLFHKWNNLEARHNLLFEAGYLYYINSITFFDIGFDYVTGITNINDKSSSINIGIGIFVLL